MLGAPTPVEQQVSPDLEGLLGRPPRTFAEWAARNVDAFRRAVSSRSRRSVRAS
ncbi:hypothetical protein BTZ20_5602 [Rhodococcus sp. MTM3W5.2]|nr:hypothetical protein BTZ20_5602 [Rhodococcus sp. MTM3W5.2]